MFRVRPTDRRAARRLSRRGRVGAGSRLADLVFPPLCLGCALPLPVDRPLGQELCPDCARDTDFLRGAKCPCCGRPFEAEDAVDHLCGPCLSQPPPFDLARAAARHIGPLAEAVRGFKYQRRLGLLPGLSRMLAAVAVDLEADLVLPVPLHWRRRRERGFNQAWLLARRMARHLGLPARSDLLRRIRFTAPQVGLTDTERQANVRGAFALGHDNGVDGQRVMLVDDVLTTGATARACARVLQRGGAAGVAVVTLTRA